MSRLIIICGLPGTGKTTLANSLSQKLKIFCLHKDSVKESIFESMKMETFEDSIRLGYPSVKAILDLAQENLNRGVDVILESPFNFPEDGHIFEKWKKTKAIEVYTIILEIDPDERKKRFELRERHEAHQDNYRKRQYENAIASFDHMPEKKLYLNTGESIDILTDRVIDFIGGLNHENNNQQ